MRILAAIRFQQKPARDSGIAFGKLRSQLPDVSKFALVILQKILAHEF
jgi:hypothetical protein